MSTNTSSRHARSESRTALCILVCSAVPVAFWFIASSYPASSRVAAIGGFIALCGVILMALPVLRVGPFQWVANLYINNVFGDDSNQSTLTRDEQKQMEDQRKLDLIIQNVFGPYLIGIGTFVNGISGFF